MIETKLSWLKRHLPQTMSNVHKVTYGNILNESLFTSFDSFLTKVALCSLKISIKSSRILKWNAGVKIYFGEHTKTFECEIYVKLPISSCDLDSHLPFFVCATFGHGLSKVRCLAMGVDMSSQNFCQYALDCSGSAKEKSRNAMKTSQSQFIKV